MDQQEFKGLWNQLKGEVKIKWSELTDDQVGQVEGSKDKLIGMLQEKYGWTKDQAEQQVNEWSDHLRELKK